VDNSKIIDGSEIRVGHRLISISSSGLHSNGYSLVRKICFEVLGMKIDTHVPELGQTIGKELLTPTRIYSDVVQMIRKDLPIHGLAHITGGGIADNVIRVIPRACDILMYQGSWDIPPIFSFLQQAGNVSDEEMMRTFNNGIGMIAIVPEASVSDVQNRLEAIGERSAVVGEIVKKENSDTRVRWVPA